MSEETIKEIRERHQREFEARKSKYAHYYDPIPDHEHTCGECCRYGLRVREDGTRRCTAVYGPDVITADRKACERYWDRAEQERIDREAAEKREHERQERRKKNWNNPARPARWQRDIDFSTGRPTGAMPFCPNCDEPLYYTDRCYFCGQAIEQNDMMLEFEKPPEVVYLDCFPKSMGGCGGKGTMECTVSRYNGHKHGVCTVCGARFIE